MSAGAFLTYAALAWAAGCAIAALAEHFIWSR